jgi:hypothetical protein
MQAYKLNTYISNEGIILLTSFPDLYNKNVELIILPLEEEKKSKIKEEENNYTVLNFINEFSGILEGMNDEDLENAKYERLKNKYLE